MTARLPVALLPVFSLPGLLLLGLAGGCAHHASEAQATAADRIACRQHTDEVYLMHNPQAVYQADTYSTSARDTPFASTGVAGNTSQGLSGQYQRDEMMSDCLDVGAAPEAPAPENAPDTAQ